MPKSRYIRKKTKTGKFMHYRIKPNGKKKLISVAAYNRGKGLSKSPNGRRKNNKKSSARKSTSGRRKMARGNGSSYSKTNIALGTLMSQVVPKFAPGVAQFLPLTALIPKAPVALKVMGWGLASKIVSDRFINR